MRICGSVNSEAIAVLYFPLHRPRGGAYGGGLSPHFHTSSDIYTRQGRLLVLNTYQVWFYTLRYYRGQNDTHNVLILIYSSM